MNIKINKHTALEIKHTDVFVIVYKIKNISERMWLDQIYSRLLANNTQYTLFETFNPDVSNYYYPCIVLVNYNVLDTISGKCIKITPTLQLETVYNVLAINYLYI